MFSLADKLDLKSKIKQDIFVHTHKNVQLVSAVWQGILSDYTGLRGRLVGTARGQA